MCACGTDMPGRCPGRANCLMEHRSPECVACGDEITRTRDAYQDANDEWLCAVCYEAALEEQAGCNEGSR